jgi:hypothetical protein
VTNDWGDIFTKLSYWYGLSYSEIANMPIKAIEAYLEKLEIRKTETKLMFADVISLPNMKKKDRVDLVGKWIRTLNINQPVQARPANPAILKLIGIGVRYVK